jgi:superfamily I DNA/RNA helicase
MQRARYLAAQHPRWEIAVLTFNTRLAEILQANLKGIPNIKATNFDKLCATLLSQARRWRSPQDPDGWISNRADRWIIVAELGAKFIADEIKWIKEMNIETRAAYQAVERKGRGVEHRLRRDGHRRQQIYDILEAYDAWLVEQGDYDWADVPHLVLEGLDAGAIQPPLYDAIFIDEAQDFAPSWIKVIKRLLKPDAGLIFMVDDPSQSIYRYYSWREKGIPVVGRTRWLRIPYRNTREIYQAAYEVIQEDEMLKQNMEELGMAMEPDLNSEYLRSGPRPQLRKFRTAEHEFTFIRSEIEWLLQKGYDAREIVVLHRRKRGVDRLRHVLRGTGVEASTFHALKGLEYEVAFLSQMQETFPPGTKRSEKALSEERRLVYMAMTRARERLYLSYEEHWPAAIAGVRNYTERTLSR